MLDLGWCSHCGKQDAGSSNIELSYDPTILLLHIYLKKTKTPIQKDMFISKFTVALFIIVMIWKKPHSQTGVCVCVYKTYIHYIYICKTYTVYICMYVYKMEHYSAIKRMKS